MSVTETYRENGKQVTLVDLSTTLTNDTRDVEPLPHQIDYADHEDNLQAGKEVFDLDPEDWPTGHAWAAENVELSSHSGTHVDAPYHYGPTSGGEPADTIDTIPLRWCFGDGVVLDFSDKPRGYGITAEDVEQELGRIDYSVEPYDIVLIRTDTYKKFHEENYDFKQPGMTRESTKYLVDQGVKLMGIDAWGFDRPFDVMVEEAKQSNKEQLWEAHFFGKDQPYLHIEKLAHLDKLPEPHGFEVFAFPYKLEDASAGWSRVVAKYEQPA